MSLRPVKYPKGLKIPVLYSAIKNLNSNRYINAISCKSVVYSKQSVEFVEHTNQNFVFSVNWKFCVPINDAHLIDYIDASLNMHESNEYKLMYGDMNPSETLREKLALVSH